MMRATQSTLVALLLLSSGCGNGADGLLKAPRTSQILITIEAIAPRHLAPFEGPIAMPSLAAVAAAGTTYDDALTTTPVARPALVTILTGQSPDRSSVRDNIFDALPATATTLAQGAQKAGFDTAAFVSSPFASYASGLQRGFALFDGPEAQMIGPAQYCGPGVAAPEVAGHFKQWLSARPKGKPFFAWIHLADLNCMATRPPGSQGSSVPKSGDPMEDYDNALKGIDEAIGTILAAARSDADANAGGLVLVGTHSPYLGEGGRRGDAFWLADETLRIPLIRVARLSDAAAAAPKHDARPTWLPDVAASLGAALGTKLTLDPDAVPLEAAPPQGRIRLAWTYAPDDQLAWPPLTAAKQSSRLAVFAAEGADLRVIDGAFPAAEDAVRKRPALPRRRALDEAHRKAIEKHGFELGLAAGPVATPKDVDAWLRDLQIARVYMSMLRPQLAMRASRDLLDRSPDSLAALETRIVLLSAMSSEEGFVLRRKVLSLYSDRSDVLHWAAHLSLIDQTYEVATAFLDAAIAVGPVEPEMYYDRACVYARTGRTKDALDELKVAINAGYRNWDWIDQDPDMSSMRTEPEFVALLKTHGR